MEFPDLGKQCFFSSCQELDFLPFKCDYCQYVFCKNHSSVDQHNCESHKNNIVTQKKRSAPITFSHNFGFDGIPLTPCTKCDENVTCITKHTCKQSKLELKRNKAKFLEAKSVVDKAVDENLKKALKDSKMKDFALKISLLKIKNTAVGDNHIALQDRKYFKVFPPLNSSKPCKAMWVSINWTVGKCIDFFCTKFKMINDNNKPGKPMLRLFNIEGTLLDASMYVNSLINDDIITNAGSLILEYQTENTVQLVNDVPQLINLDKYA